MKYKYRNELTESGKSRRRFVLGATSMLTLGALSNSKLVSAMSLMPQQNQTRNQYDLTIGYQKVNITGKERLATSINGSLPAPVLRWKEGERVTLKVTNNLDTDSSIHWHGMILPYDMDGVPGISFDGIQPGETFEYSFDVQQSGTYWYHSHSGFQEQTGLYGAIVIDPLEPDPVKYDRDYVVMLSDWSDEEPDNIYRKLKKLSHYYNFQERTTSDLYQEISKKGMSETWEARKMWNQMRMSDRDISDVTGYTYTFLMNGVTPADGWVGLFKKGEKIRLRFINAAAMTFFDVRIPGLKMTVVAADGQNIQPVTVDEFRIGVAETYDVIVEPDKEMPYTLFAQTIDRTGYARGTLTHDPALRGEVPEMDPPPVLTMNDMGMDHAGMEHGGHTMNHSPEPAMDHSGHQMNTEPQSVMDHSNHGMNSNTKVDDHSGHSMNVDSEPLMDHSSHQMDSGTQSVMDHSTHSNDMSSPMSMANSTVGKGSTTQIVHKQSEFGPHVDMRAESPKSSIDDPGIGLREHAAKLGRRVLTYADIKNLYKTQDQREPGREIQLHLTGNMSRYMWSIDGVKFKDAEPLVLQHGERVRITFVNDTMMNHPMHLHGMWSELETGDGNYLPKKHTVIVQPGAKISYLVTADAKGDWAFHCHLLYHMLGMMRKVKVV
ncbi:copper resistance system multicopper oxidase [Kaarinaea lacus]